MKKETIIFIVVSVIRTLYNQIPIAILKYGSLESHAKIQQFLNSGMNHKLGMVVMISYYMLFIACIFYSVVKKNTSSYVLIWLTWIGYVLINYWLSNSSLLLLNERNVVAR